MQSSRLENFFKIACVVALFFPFVISEPEDVKKEVKSDVEEAGKKEFNLNCEYEDTDLGYTCTLNGIDIRHENTQVTSFTGVHVPGKSDLDVNRIAFLSGKMIHLPIGLGLNFKNLDYFQIKENIAFTHVKRSDFLDVENLDTLYIYENDMETLDEDTLWDLQNLKKFAIENNKIKIVHNRTFEKNTKLIILYLGENEIEILHENTLKNLPDLELLNIHQNKLKLLHEKTFEKNSKLRDLYLSNNELETLDVNILRDLPDLEIFSYAYNTLKKLHEKTFEKNTKIREIYLGGNEIETLHENVFENLLNLEILELYENQIKVLHERTFEKNTKLRSLNLDSNQLEVLPRNLFENNLMLEMVGFVGNSIKTIQVDFTGLKNMKELLFCKNFCINGYYGELSDDDDPDEVQYANLIDLQSVLRENCTFADT